MSKVVTLKTKDVREKESVERVIKGLNDDSGSGNIRSIAAVYYDKNDDVFTWVSSSMTARDLAYAIKLLDTHLDAYFKVKDEP